jgi:hypothetical protein
MHSRSFSLHPISIDSKSSGIQKYKLTRDELLEKSSHNKEKLGVQIIARRKRNNHKQEHYL